MENNKKNINISIIIPAYNEEKNIENVINNLKAALKANNFEYEIIIINDGSTDNTTAIIKNINNIKIINQPYNKGYGAALKAGAENSRYDWLLFFDADGQHDPAYITKFISYAPEYELIAGDRSKSKYIRPMMRKPGLWLLGKIANYLVEFNIPDLNCGMRLVNKNALSNYLHLMPDGFSMSTTSTLAFLKDKKNVKFVPIEVNKRGKNTTSAVKPKHALTTLMLIFRLIMIFSPLKIFFPISFTLFIIGTGFLAYDLLNLNITDSSVFILLSSMLIFFFGLIADQISATRREINN